MLTIAAAKRTPGLMANFLNGMLQEHERALGGWQSEWVTVQGMVQAAGVVLESMAEVIEGLRVDPQRMRRNIETTQGTVFSEKAMMLLAETMGRDEARRLVEDALQKTGSPPELPGLLLPEAYLGSAEAFRVRLLEEES
jgi:3-carboxy-cis,cis-muconate cycloisomerase